MAAFLANVAGHHAYAVVRLIQHLQFCSTIVQWKGHRADSGFLVAYLCRSVFWHRSYLHVIFVIHDYRCVIVGHDLF